MTFLDLIALTIYVAGAIIATPIVARNLFTEWAKLNYQPDGVIMALAGAMCILVAFAWPILFLGFVVAKISAGDRA